jgi:tetratricopeptide (TPR) repeat protein
MAVDKNKVTAEATKFVQKGQWDKAIKAYDKILAEDPKDVRVLLKVGELHQKKGDNESAAVTFNRVADAYSEQGFFLKAVAVYKQILKLTPDDCDINEKLAGLYQQLGLMSDAMAQLQIVAGAFERAADGSRLLEVLKRMVDLDPDNIASRIKLGELFAKSSQVQPALAEFRKAADNLKRNNRIEEYIKVAERIAFLAPDDMELTRELANIYLAKGDTKRALAKLQLCFKSNPKDIETLNLLGQAFKDLGQLSKTVSVYKELAKVYEEEDRVDDMRATYRKILEIAPDDPEARAAVAGRQQPAASMPPMGGPPPGARAPMGGPPPGVTVTKNYPAPAPTKNPPPQPTGPRLGPEAIGKLLTETDVYVKYGLHDKALEHLKRIFAIDPDHPDAHEKARDLLLAGGNQAGAADEAAALVRVLLDRGLSERAEAAWQKLLELNAAHPAVAELQGQFQGGGAGAEADAGVEIQPTFEEGSGEVMTAEPLPEEGEELIVADSEEPLLAPEDAPSGLSNMEKGQDDDLALAAATSGGSEEVIEEEPFPEAPAEDAALVQDDPAPEFVSEPQFIGEPELEVDAQFGAPGEAEPEVEIDTEFSDDIDVDDSRSSDDARALAIAEAALASATGAPGEEEIVADEPSPEGDAEVGFDAVRTSPELRRDAFMDQATDPGQPPAAPGGVAGFQPTEMVSAQKVKELIAEASASPGGNFDPTAVRSFPAASAAVTTPAMRVPVPSRPPGRTTEVVAASGGEEELVDLSDEIEEADFFIQQGLFDEARDALNNLVAFYGDHPHVIAKMAELDRKVASEADAEESTATPAVASPDAEAVPLEGDDSFDIARELAEELGGDDAAAAAAAPADDFQYSVEDVFAQFKKGVAKTVKAEDSETHFDLGIAYKEMGLLDDAISEFNVALQGNSRKKEIDCFAMIADCCLKKGDVTAAINALKKGLHSDHLSGESAKALHYELGGAYHRLGDTEEALYYYQKVFKNDPGYREVRAIIDTLGGGQGRPPPDEVDEAGEPSRNGSAKTPPKPPAGATATGLEKAPPGGKGTKKNIGYV